MIARAMIIVAMALVLAALVVRVAFVDAYAGSNPARAAAVWAGHPSVILTSGLEEVGEAAASARPVNPATVRRMIAVSTAAPLAPEPYLVRGVEARLRGDEPLAYRALLEARKRDPRSIAAHYFLADHYVRIGQTRQGLTEIASLTRLVPQSLEPIAPYLAAFARGPGGVQQVRALLNDQPILEPVLLAELAGNPGDVGLALALWNGRTSERDRVWQERLVNTLVEAGRYPEARSYWARFNPGAKSEGELIDPRFEAEAGPPFGWALASGPGGVAERDGGGRLHILYYGRENLALASQLLMLPPGRHRLSMRIGGASPSAQSLAWKLSCQAPSRELASIGLDAVKGGALVADFNVPSDGCAAQRLDLSGTSPDLPEQVDITIAELRLARVGS
jgi:hypothetical protein